MYAIPGILNHCDIDSLDDPGWEAPLLTVGAFTVVAKDAVGPADAEVLPSSQPAIMEWLGRLVINAN